MDTFNVDEARSGWFNNYRGLLFCDGEFRGSAEVRGLKRYQKLQGPAAPARRRELAPVGYWLSQMGPYRYPFQYGSAEGGSCIGGCDMGEPSWEEAHYWELKAAEFHAHCACIDIFEYCQNRGVEFAPTDVAIELFSRCDPTGMYNEEQEVSFTIPNGALTEQEVDGAGKCLEELFPRICELDFAQYDGLNRAGIHLRNLDPTDGLDDVFGAISFLRSQQHNKVVGAKVRGLGPFFEGRTPLHLTQEKHDTLRKSATLFWPDLRTALRKRSIGWRRQLGLGWERKLARMVAQTSLAPEDFPVPIDLDLVHFFRPT